MGITPTRLRARVRTLLGHDATPTARAPIDPEARVSHGHGVGAQSLSGHRALLCGAGRIGRAIASELSARGAHITCLDASPEARASIEAAVPGMDTAPADLSSEADIERAFAGFGHGEPHDMLVHATSFQLRPPRGLLDSEPGDWTKTFATNLFGPVHITRLWARALTRAQRPGSVLFIGSVHQWITGGWPEYSAAKSALTMVVKELALELAPHGIRVNAIAPGWVADRDERHAADFDHAPLAGRAIPPEYVGRSAAFLLSPHDSAFTTGAILQLDGGLSLRSYRTPARAIDGDPHVRRWS